MNHPRFRSLIVVLSVLALLTVDLQSASAFRRFRRSARRHCPPVPCVPCVPCAPSPEPDPLPCICIRQKIGQQGSIKIYRANQHYTCESSEHCSAATPCIHASVNNYTAQDCMENDQCINSPAYARSRAGGDDGDIDIGLAEPHAADFDFDKFLAAGWEHGRVMTGRIKPPDGGDWMTVKVILLKDNSEPKECDKPLEFGFGFEIKDDESVKKEFEVNADAHRDNDYRYEFTVDGIKCFVIASR